MPQLSTGWLVGFNRRHALHREAGSVDLATVESQLQELRTLIQVYPPRDVFTMDQTGLFWKLVPRRTLATGPISGIKQEKAQITIALTCNTVGDKLPPWIVGKAQEPRCFKKANIKISSFNCQWRANKIAWWNTIIMTQYLRWFDSQMSGRLVLLLVDNFSAHECALNQIRRELRHTRVEFLPPNTTSHLQPLDQGIIQQFKIHYHRKWLLYMLQEVEAGRNAVSRANLLHVLQWITDAWTLDVSETFIQHCWFKSSLLGVKNSLPVPKVLQATEEDSAVEDVRRLIAQLVLNPDERMAIGDFLNPIEEQVIDPPQEDLIDHIASQFGEEREAESDEEDIEVPRVSSQEALHLLRQLRTYEQQQEQADISLLAQLDMYERIVQRR